MKGRVPPQALDAEKALLASIMLDHEALDTIPHVPVGAFYSERHRVIYRAIKVLDERGIPPDLTAIIQELTDSKALETSGGIPYLMGLWDVEPTGAYAAHYANLILEKHRLRELISVTGKSMEEAFNSEPADRVIAELELGLTNLARFDAIERGPAQFVQDALDLVDGVGGLSTGLVDVDTATGGLVKGGYNVIAARPSVGKSGVLRGILQHRVREGDRVALFSNDQSGGDIYGLTAAAMVGKSLSDFRTGKATQFERQKFEDALNELASRWDDRLVVYDTLTDAARILQAARREIRNGATVIAVDHLQSISLDGQTDDSHAVSSISRLFKALSREFNVTVVLLSQLGRSVEMRPNKRPMLSDLRQSGAIEEDANQVLFLYRDAYYNPGDEHVAGLMEVIVAKNKLGAVPLTVKVRWESKFAQAQNLATRSFQ